MPKKPKTPLRIAADRAMRSLLIKRPEFGDGMPVSTEDKLQRLATMFWSSAAIGMMGDLAAIRMAELAGTIPLDDLARGESIELAGLVIRRKPNGVIDLTPKELAGARVPREAQNDNPSTDGHPR